MTPATPCAVPAAALVARLRDRAADLATALDGNVLTVSVRLTGESPGYSVVFSPDGHVSLLVADQSVGSRLRPHVHLQGSADDVLRIVLGETDAATAAFADQLRLSVSPAELTPHYGRVMRIVREEVWAILESERMNE